MDHAAREFVTLRHNWTVEQALAEIRTQKVPGPILYFYVIDDDGRLVGVLPTRALLTAQPDASIESLMVKRLVTLPESASMETASELFVMHRFLAIPIVDKDMRPIGVIDVNAFSSEVLDIAERRNADVIFEAIGLRISGLTDVSPPKAFRLRFPWLISTIAGGTACALLSSVFGATLAESIVLAFFLTLVLGLGESVATQSMTLALQLLRSSQPTFGWFVAKISREFASALLIGGTCGLIVGAIAQLWHGNWLESATIGGSIAGSIVTAALLGVTVPTLLHTLKLDPRVASGPLTLAFTDLATITIYFGTATLVL
jgi:magnesium transporter